MTSSSRREILAKATILSAWAGFPSLSLCAPDPTRGQKSSFASGIFLTAKEYGASGDGFADDTRALQAGLNAAATLGATLRLDPRSKVYLTGEGISVRSGASASDGTIAANGSVAHAVAVNGTDISLSRLTINTRSSSAITGAANSGLVSIEALRVGSPTSAERGHGLRLDAGGNAYWSLSNSLINVSGYGVLTGTQAGGPGNIGLRVVNNAIFAGADGIEINAPNTAETNFIIANNLLETYGAAQPSSGFAFGVAHGQGFIFNGNLIQKSSAEAIHIEDGAKLGVFSAFIARQPFSGIMGTEERSAITHYAAGPNRSDSGPMIFVGFALDNTTHRPSKGSSGYRALNNDGQGIISRSPIVAGYFHGYESALFFCGPGIIPLGYLSVENCYYALRLTIGAEAYNSTIYSRGVKTFLQSNGGGATAGFFHEEDSASAPTIILPTPAAVMGSTVEGFSCGVTTSLHPGENALVLFDAPRRIRGTLTLRTQAENGWFFWEGDVIYNGIELSVAQDSIIMEAYGEILIGASAISVRNGKIFAAVNYLGPNTQSIVTRIKFKGTYYN